MSQIDLTHIWIGCAEGGLSNGHKATCDKHQPKKPPKTSSCLNILFSSESAVAIRSLLQHPDHLEDVKVVEETHLSPHRPPLQSLAQVKRPKWRRKTRLRGPEIGRDSAGLTDSHLSSNLQTQHDFGLRPDSLNADIKSQTKRIIGFGL